MSVDRECGASGAGVVGECRIGTLQVGFVVASALLHLRGQ